MKGYMKEIIADSAILSLLIIFPMAIGLGPGWRSKNPSTHVASQRFQQEHRPIPGETPEERTGSDRDIPILQAFKDDGKR
jgi:hypothetical protein